MKKYILFVLLLFIVSCSSHHDPYADLNFTYTPSIYEKELNYRNLTSYFAKGDAILVKARTQDMDPYDSIFYYKKSLKTASPEEKAILYETIASISNNNFCYLKSYLIWKSLDNDFRANLDWHLLLGQEPDYQFEDYSLPESNYNISFASKFAIGNSYLTISSNDTLVSQVDRVNRDWLSSQLNDPYSTDLLTIFSEGYDVNDIGWHEGGRLKQYNLSFKPLTGTIVKKINNTWYAPNENGIFMFEVPVDKVEYPTTRFFRDDLALIIDTHGINMLVEQAINSNATVVVGCCDAPSKIKAALYLNEKGIKVICNTDKYLSLLLGQTNLTIGSAPFESNNGSVVIGNRPLVFNFNEEIIVENATEDYSLSYYSTPTIYFSHFPELKLTYVTINGFNQTSMLVGKAQENKAHIIAARVYNENDYAVLKRWLEDSEKNKLLLFHSISYPYGYLLFQEYPNQTTFGDIMPIFS